MPFGANEKVASGIELDAAADVPGKVIAGGVVGAGIKVAVQVLTVETGAERANTSLEFQVGMVGYLGCINGIDVEKDRAIGLITSPFTLGRFPVDFASDAYMVEDLHVTTKAGISASVERYGLMAAACLAGASRFHRTEADSKVGLLRLRGI